MGALDHLRRILATEEIPVRELTPIDIVWIEERVTATLAANDLECNIERGFLRVLASSNQVRSDAVSLAPLGHFLLSLDRSLWPSYVWEWCADNIIDVDTDTDTDIDIDIEIGTDIEIDSYRNTDTDGPSDLPEIAEPGLRLLASLERAMSEEPEPDFEPTDDALGMSLADAVMALSVRFISENCVNTVPVGSLSPTAIPGVAAALCLDDARWVSRNDLANWGITTRMALEIAEARIRDSADPDVSVVFLDDATPVFVVETEGPDVLGLLPYLDSHVPIRMAESAVVLVAVANEHVMYVHVAGSETLNTSMRTMIERAATEHTWRPGLVSPALFRWSEDGSVKALTPTLDTAAGRLEARQMASLDALIP